MNQKHSDLSEAVTQLSISKYMDVNAYLSFWYDTAAKMSSLGILCPTHINFYNRRSFSTCIQAGTHPEGLSTTKKNMVIPLEKYAEVWRMDHW